MPLHALMIETDVDRYRSAIRPASVEFTVTGRQRFLGKVVRIDFDNLWMQRGQESAPRIWRADPSEKRTIVSFLTDPGQTSHRNGVEFSASHVALHSHRQPYWHVTATGPRWGAMSLPRGTIAALGGVLAGRDFNDVVCEEIIVPPSAELQHLRSLHAAAARIAETSPHLIECSESAHGLEQALIEAMMACLATPAHRAGKAAIRARRIAIVEQFRSYLEAHHEHPVYIPEVCEALGIPGRTLRFCCEEFLGVGPKRYLLLRRLHLAREALRAAQFGEKSVTEIATSLGFWELGRFAVSYKSLFGESPSVTLCQG